MLKYVLKSIVFGFLFASSLEVMAQTEVLIRLKDDANVRKYVVAEKGKISFTNDLLFVDQMASSALVSFDLNTIQSVKFLPATAGVDMVFSDGEGAFIFPNPATDNFYFANMEEKSLVSVYSLEGSLVLRQSYVPGIGIPVSGLPNGLYIVIVGNQTFKLEKK
ncbi:MAG: T9SS type A sorting domain-containing protein [Paludibacteraceae bacterium]|nr:T9SS type A sorting domain-containing protein [Paludibacteraceae bacterium]